MEEVFLRLAQAAARDANTAPGTPGRIEPQLQSNGGAGGVTSGTRAAALLGPGKPALVRPMAQQVEMVEIASPAISAGEIGSPVISGVTSPSEITPHVPLTSSTRQDSPRLAQVVPSPSPEGGYPADRAGEGAVGAGTHADDAEGMHERRRPPSFGKQMGLLLRKRFTCARRDKKALLSQQLLPVLLVGLVMLILTIKYRRAGPSLRLHAAVFGEELTQLVHNAEDDSPWLPSLEQADAMQLDPYHVGLADSQQVSEYLLDTFNDHSRPPRFGAQRILTLTLTLTLTVTSKPNPTP